MLRDLFSNRLFIGGLAFFIFCVGGSLLYMQHVERETAREMAAHEERIKQLTEKPKPTAVEAPVGETPQGHVHEDGTFHTQPHETPSLSEVDTPEPVQVSDALEAPQREYNRGAGNPHPFENVPVDLWNFEATKAAMIENINFFKANWNPKVYNREVSIADSLTANISNAAMSPEFGLFTPEQCKELRALRMELLAFKGVESGRVKALQDQGHTLDEALRIATDETLQRQGVK